MVEVVRIAEMGCFVNIIGHDRQGIILLSELHRRRRIRNIRDILRQGERFVALVQVIDAAGVGLSKWRVNPEEVARIERDFNQH